MVVRLDFYGKQQAGEKKEKFQKNLRIKACGKKGETLIGRET